MNIPPIPPNSSSPGDFGQNNLTPVQQVACDFAKMQILIEQIQSQESSKNPNMAEIQNDINSIKSIAQNVTELLNQIPPTINNYPNPQYTELCEFLNGDPNNGIPSFTAEVSNLVQDFQAGKPITADLSTMNYLLTIYAPYFSN